MTSGNWFLRIKKNFFDFHFVCNWTYYIVIISKTLTEEIWDLTLRLNPVRYEVKSVKCYEYIKTKDSFPYHRVLSTLVFRLRWFRTFEIYQALASQYYVEGFWYLWYQYLDCNGYPKVSWEFQPLLLYVMQVAST